MDKHNSLLLTEIGVLAFFAAVAFPIAGFVRGLFHLSRPAWLLAAIAIWLGLAWLFYWIANTRNREP